MKSLGIEVFENLHSLEPAEAALKGTITILGALHHAWFIRVQEVGDGIEAVHDPYGRLDEVVEQNGNGLCPRISWRLRAVDLSLRPVEAKGTK